MAAEVDAVFFVQEPLGVDFAAVYKLNFIREISVRFQFDGVVSIFIKRNRFSGSDFFGVRTDRYFSELEIVHHFVRFCVTCKIAVRIIGIVHNDIFRTSVPAVRGIDCGGKSADTHHCGKQKRKHFVWCAHNRSPP